MLCTKVEECCNMNHVVCDHKVKMRRFQCINTIFLGVVYIMDHEVARCFSRICDWLLNSSRAHFGLHRGEKCQSDHGISDTQKACFHAYIIHCHGSIGFCSERSQKGSLTTKVKESR